MTTPNKSFFRRIQLLDLRAIEIAFAIEAILAGLWMGWPYNHPYRSTNAIYIAMTRTLSPHLWTLLFFSFGVPPLILTYLRKHFPSFDNPFRYIRVGSAFVSAWVWSSLFAIFWLDKATGLSTIWVPFMALTEVGILVWLLAPSERVE